MKNILKKAVPFVALTLILSGLAVVIAACDSGNKTKSEPAPEAPKIAQNSKTLVAYFSIASA